RPPSRRLEPSRSGDRGLLGGGVGGTEFTRVAVGLFEVVAADLVTFDEMACALVQPESELLMQLSTHRLRQALIGRVANQQVPKAIGVVARQSSKLGSDEVLAHQGHELGRNLIVV